MKERRDIPLLLGMVGLVITMALAIYVRHKTEAAKVTIIEYRLSQIESENKNLVKKYYILEKNLSDLRHSLDADGAIVGGNEEGTEAEIEPIEK